MLADARMSYQNSLRHYFYQLLAPLYQAVSQPIYSAQDLAQSFSHRQLLLAENQYLRDQNLQLQVRLQRFEDLIAENQRLQKLLGATPSAAEKILLAQVMAVDLDPFSRKMVLNKGTSHQVEIGLPVFDAQGVMGQIMEVSSLTSMVMLITDPDHTLPVQVKRTGLHTIAAGVGKKDSLKLLYLPNTAEIGIGDELITSGLGGRFPAGYPVAVVSQFQPVIGKPYAEATARPNALLDRNRDVLLVWHLPQEIHTPTDTQDKPNPPEPRLADDS